MMLTMDPRLMLGDRYCLIYYTYLVTIYLRGDWEQFSRRYRAMMIHFPGKVHEHSPEAFGTLIERIKVEGFQDCSPVLANPQNYLLVDGEHRCAISIALGIDRIPYSQVFQTNEVARGFLEKPLLSSEEVREVEAFFLSLMARFPSDIVKTIRMRQLIRAHDKHFRDAAWANNTLFSSTRTYQGIGSLSGKRNTEIRWDGYSLEEHLHRSDEALEIGCNVGFFTSMLAKHVKHVDAFDVDPISIEVANAFKEGDTTAFRIANFEDFRTDKTYDIIVCCAVHGWVSIGFGDFVMKLFGLLKPNGILLFESHEILCEKDWPRRKALLEASCEILHRGFIDDVDHSLYPSEIREHMILRPHARAETLRGLIRSCGFSVGPLPPGLAAGPTVRPASMRSTSDYTVKVSIVLPTYNHAAFLPQAINSILKQTLGDFELLIVNDGSTDDTPRVLAGYTDKRIRVINQVNRGLPTSLNIGFSQASGRYHTWTSADNVVAPAWLEELVAALEQSPPETGVALSHYATINEADQIVRIDADQCFETHSMMGWNSNASFLYRAELARRVGGYDDALTGAEDLDLWLRMSLHTRAVLVDSVLYYYRRHDDSMSKQIPEKIRVATRRTYEKLTAGLGGKLDIDKIFPMIAMSADPALSRWKARIWLSERLANNEFWPAQPLVDLIAASLAEHYDPALVGNIVVIFARHGAWASAAEAVAICVRLDQSSLMRSIADVVARRDRAALTTIRVATVSEEALGFNPHTQVTRSRMKAAAAAMASQPIVALVA